jgi:ubiquinone/menaquinone biosynthesis C-methylase UbiE
MTHSTMEKGYRGMGMEGYTAKWYASLTGKSINEFADLARRVQSRIPQSASVLEVAPGPGYFAIEMAKLGDYRVAGLDISETFVKIARDNAATAGVNVDFRHGNAAGMPFHSDRFDFLLCRAAFKNFSQPEQAMREMCRVLKPGGLALIIDLRRDATPESIRDAVDDMHLNAVNSAITRLTFRFVLLKRAYTRDQFVQFIDQTRFGAMEIQEDAMGLEIWLRK